MARWRDGALGREAEAESGHCASLAHTPTPAAFAFPCLLRHPCLSLPPSRAVFLLVADPSVPIESAPVQERPRSRKRGLRSVEKLPAAARPNGRACNIAVVVSESAIAIAARLFPFQPPVPPTASAPALAPALAPGGRMPVAACRRAGQPIDRRVAAANLLPDWLPNLLLACCVHVCVSSAACRPRPGPARRLAIPCGW